MQAEYNAKKKAFFLSIVEAPPIFANEKENKKYKKNNNDYGIRAHWFFACGLYGLIGLASAPIGFLPADYTD